MDDIVVQSLHGIPLPTEILGPPTCSISDMECSTPGLGYSIAYSAFESIFTVFVYDKGLNEIPDGPYSECVQSEFTQAVHEAQIHSAAQGWKLTFVDWGVLDGDKVAPHGFCVAGLDGVDGDGQYFTQILVTGVRDKFLKVRISSPPDPGRALELVADFVRRYCKLLWP